MQQDGRHDFDFLHGRWQVQNERLRERLAGCDDWEVFPAIDACRPLLGGLGNLEEFHAERDGGCFEAIGLRLLDAATRTWCIHWASDRGAVLEPPVRGRFRHGVGEFFGDDQHGGRPVRVRYLWRRLGAHGARWEQAFSTDDGASWETNWRMWFRRLGADGRLLHEDAVVELRQYTLHPGRRDDLVALFEREFVEPQEAVGMHVIGTFRDLDAPDRFVWLRGFPSMAARREALQGFYGGPVWRRHREAANATMVDSDDVRLLRPLADGALPPPPPRPAFGVDAPAGAFCLGTCALAAPAEAGFANRFEAVLAPLLRERGAELVARWVTEPAPNSFPRLPVREGEPVLAWLARFADVAALDAHLAALRDDAAWRDALAACDELVAPPSLQRLLPTARSELR